jgi:hypothetical protein
MHRSVTLALAVFISFFAGTLVPTAHTEKSQSPQPEKAPKYIEVDFMKVDPGKDAEYLKLEQQMWKPIHQERVKEGKLRSWYLFALQFPFGTDEKYDYVTVNTFDQFAQLENPYLGFAEAVRKVHPSMKMDDLSNTTYKARRLVRSEIWAVIDHTD